MEEAVDWFAGVGRYRGREFGVSNREIVGFGHGVDRRPDDRMIDRLGDQLAEEIDRESAAPEGLEVFRPGADATERRRRLLRRCRH